MLKGLKNQGLSLVPPSHVDLFVEHYDQLKRWALQFTNRDQHAAEDLLHDTFIALTLGKPDLSAIQNLDGYLYTVMRNLHLSEVRRAARMPVSSFSVVEYDTAEMPFWVSDPREHIRMRDELAAVCQYACARKESSKGGSLLILRFFHGYYPDEIASVMKTIRSAVTSKLTKVRTEVKLFLEEPDRLRLFSDDLPDPLVLNTNPNAGDLRLQLREYIFDSCQGEHLDQDAINAFYSTESPVVPDRTILAHIVSCETCIEKVNLVLGLPSLASRYPLDMVGKDPGKRGGSDGGGNTQGPTSAGTGGKESMLDSYIKRRDAHFYHEPRELCIAVNGQFQGLQKIVSGKGELMLPIDMNESLGFVEVFSELGVRLLIMPVEPPPIGDGDQFACVELSNGRTIDANLNFGGTLPSLRVAYNDPELISALAPAIESMEMTLEPNGVTNETKSSAAISGESKIFSSYTDKRKLFSLATFLQPFRLATAFTLLLIIALVWLRFGPSAPVSAAELLANSAKAEDVFLANPDRVLHRTLNLEELNGNGQVRSRKKIDVWQSAANGITARRLYDETGTLVMGDWRRSDGVQTIYKRGEAAKLQPLPEKRAGSIGFDDAWQLSLSAKEFTAMLDRIDEAQLETRGNTYFVSYNPQAGNRYGIVNASLLLNRDDLHPIEQAFTLRNGDETRSFRMVEASYEWRPQNSVAPAVFEPGIELTGIASKQGTYAPNTSNNSNTNTSSEESIANTEPSVAVANIATPALQVEVIEALNNAGAFMGEQVSVSNTPDGKIFVSALVETEQRKKELLAALANVRNNPAVRLKIETVAEVQARQKRTPSSGTPSPMSVDQVDPSEDQNPVYAELKKKLSDDEARRFAANILNRSRQAGLHVLAMKQVADRFSQADLQALNPQERARWIDMIRNHAESFLRETQSLQRDLGQIYPEAGGASGSGDAIANDAELQAKVRELFNLSGTVERGLGQSFALTAGQSSTAPVKTAAFWRSFAEAVGVAKSIVATR